MNRRDLLLGLAAFGLASRAAAAHEFKVGDLVILHPWSRATGKTRPGVGYLKIKNLGTQTERLLGAETRIAATAELHLSVMENNVTKMSPVGGIEIPPGCEIALEPNGSHLMLMGLTQPLAEGDTFPVTLIFEHAGRVDVTFVTAAAGAIDPE